MASKCKPDEEQGAAIARTMLQPTIQAAVTLKEYGKSCGDLDLVGLWEMRTRRDNAAQVIRHFYAYKA